MRRARLASLLAAAVALGGCSFINDWGSLGVTDAGRVDSGAADSGVADSGATDSAVDTGAGCVDECTPPGACAGGAECLLDLDSRCFYCGDPCGACEPSTCAGMCVVQPDGVCFCLEDATCDPVGGFCGDGTLCRVGTDTGLVLECGHPEGTVPPGASCGGVDDCLPGYICEIDDPTSPAAGRRCLEACLGGSVCADGDACLLLRDIHGVPSVPDQNGSEVGVCPDLGFRDADGDGSPASLDCDDGNPQVFPGATEICTDGVDNDCDGLTDGDDSDCFGPCGAACSTGFICDPSTLACVQTCSTNGECPAGQTCQGGLCKDEGR